MTTRRAGPHISQPFGGAMCNPCAFFFGMKQIKRIAAFDNLRSRTHESDDSKIKISTKHHLLRSTVRIRPSPFSLVVAFVNSYRNSIPCQPEPTENFESSHVIVYPNFLRPTICRSSLTLTMTAAHKRLKVPSS